MTAPLTPPDCDLTDFQRMMIDIPRLRGSDFDATLNDAAWRAGLNLWLSAWHQVPAASLSDDDVTLTKAAGLGRDIRTWRKVRTEALRGWIKCDDGLLYHPVVAEFALEAWLEKLAQALSSGAGNAKRWKVEFDPTPIEAEIDRTAAMLADLNPKSKALVKLERRRSRNPTDTDPGGSAVGTEKASRRDAENVPSGSLGKGTGKGTREEGSDEPSLSAANASARGRSSRRKPEEPLSDGYPDAAAIADAEAWVLDSGVTLNVSAQARRFRDHAATKDRRERDWRAAWRQWVGIACETAPAAPPPTTAAERPAWSGPPELRAAVVREKGEPFAASWIDPCAWQDVPERVLVCGATALKRLGDEIPDLLAAADVKLRLQERAA